jgi:hypothetical protein
MLLMLFALLLGPERNWRDHVPPDPAPPADINEAVCRDRAARSDLKLKMQRGELPIQHYATEIRDLNQKRVSAAVKALDEQARWSESDRKAFAKRFAADSRIQRARAKQAEAQKEAMAAIVSTKGFRGSEEEQCRAFVQNVNRMKVGAKASSDYWAAASSFLDEEAGKMSKAEE